MKVLITFLTLSLIALGSFSNLANAQDYEEDCVACHASVGQLDILAQEARDNLAKKISLLDDTQDITEGKIRAAIINMVNDSLTKVDHDINDYGMTSDRSLVDVILSDIAKINRLITEL